jgi:hypothetical protein
MATFNLALRRNQYPFLTPRSGLDLSNRPGLLPVPAGVNRVTLADAVLNSSLLLPHFRVPVSACPPITGATLETIPLGNPPADWLEGLGGAAGTWGVISLAGIAAAAIGGAAIPVGALLTAGGAIGVGAAASIGATALRQAALENAARRVSLSGAEQIEFFPLGDTLCLYRFPKPAPSRRDTAASSGGILFAAALQESSGTIRVIALLPESVGREALVQATWGNSVVSLSPGPVVQELAARNWSGIAPLPQEPPQSLLVELRINGTYAGATTLGQMAEPPEAAEARGLQVVGRRYQLVWSPKPVGRFRKTLSLPTADTEAIIPPQPPILKDGRFRLAAIWRQPGLSFKSEVFVSEPSALSLRNYLEAWDPRPTDVQITETGRRTHPDAEEALWHPVRGRFWDGDKWLRFYWSEPRLGGG